MDFLTNFALSLFLFKLGYELFTQILLCQTPDTQYCLLVAVVTTTTTPKEGNCSKKCEEGGRARQSDENHYQKFLLH